MGIQINGITDTISATDGGLAVSGQQLTGVTDINASGIVTATQVNVGTGVTIHSTNGVQVGGNLVHSTGLNINQINVAGIVTAANVRTNSLVVSGVSTFAADNSNRINVGTNTARSFNSTTARIHIEGTDQNTSAITIVRNSNDANEARLVLAKTRGISVNTSAGISSADNIGRIEFNFTDSGANSQNIGYIQATNYRTATNYGGGLIFAVKRDNPMLKVLTD